MRLGLAAGALLLPLLLPLPAQAGPYNPGCPARAGGVKLTSERVVQADERIGQMECSYYGKHDGETVSWTIKSLWSGRENQYFRDWPVTGCGYREEVDQGKAIHSNDHVAMVRINEEESVLEKEARGWLRTIEAGYAHTCDGEVNGLGEPPPRPSFKFHFKLDGRGEPNGGDSGLPGYRRTTGNGSGSFTTDAGGKHPKGIKGRMVLVFRLGNGSETLALRFTKVKHAGVVNVRKMVEAVAVVTESEVPGCHRGDHVTVDIHDGAGAQPDALGMSGCGRLHRLGYGGPHDPGRSVDVVIKSA